MSALSLIGTGWLTFSVTVLALSGRSVIGRLFVGGAVAVVAMATLRALSGA